MPRYRLPVAGSSVQINTTQRVVSIAFLADLLGGSFFGEGALHVHDYMTSACSSPFSPFFIPIEAFLKRAI